MNAIEYANRVSEIFVLSDSFLRIKELIEDESSTIDDISEVILVDPALAGTILKLANSSFFNYPGKIDTISKAVLVLGITEVYNLVIAYFSTQAFKDTSANKDYLDDFWERSVDCALLIKYLGYRLHVKNSERLFILGLLHNLGELAIQQVSPEKIEQCYSDDITNLPWRKQQDILAFTYGECTAELLTLWQLPYSLVSPIRHQDEADFSQVKIESQLLYLAKRVMMQQRVFTTECFQSLINDEKLTLLEVDSEVLDDAVDYCNLERLSILSVLNPGAAMIY
ncbi:MAG: HDOD domain-containing protein [Gammaproteobacteria bacterium]|nr:MAG: HDOD domain-containing protein [Gammaproteobacteria bacterium]